MKFRLDATEDELRERGGELIDALAKALGQHAPELADALSKASIPAKEPELKHKALRELHGQMTGRARRGYDRMLAEIVQTVDDHVAKSEESPDYTTKIVAKEQVAYDRMKDALIDQGYRAEDFEENGALYGASVNELRDLMTAAVSKGDS